VPQIRFKAGAYYIVDQVLDPSDRCRPSSGRFAYIEDDLDLLEWQYSVTGLVLLS
jgi:hypothetical protein